MELENEKTKIAVFGGGRWARVLLGIFLVKTNANIEFTVHTKNLVDDMQKWIKNSAFKDRVFIFNTEPDFAGSNYMAAIVVNSADSHKKSAEMAIKSKVPVLIEKPMASSFKDTLSLIKSAKVNGTLLSMSRVFLYTKYLDNFIAQLGNVDDIQSLCLIWTDEFAEMRHGERKSFDPATPIFRDVLPHILSILFKIFQTQDVELKSCKAIRGGCSVEIIVFISNVECCLILERNSNKRQRKIIVKGHKDCVLDFSVEPGKILVDGNTFCGDLFWDSSPSPLEKMVLEFLTEVNLGKIYQDCSSKLALSTSKLIDQIEPAYHNSLDKWLSNYLYRQEIEKRDIHYFLSELVLGALKVGYDKSEEIISQYLDIISCGQLLKYFKNTNKEISRKSIIGYLESLEIRA